MDRSGTIRKTCHFSGRVQGVGFRYTARSIAGRYDITGYVRNLPDGRVELVMEGPPAELNQVLDEINYRMSGFIRQVQQQDSPATGEFKELAIRH